MVELDIDRLLHDFFQRAEAFIAAPDIRKALELDELAGRANTAWTTPLRHRIRHYRVLHRIHAGAAKAR